MEALQHYYELTGTSAVTLIGLLFVVITLGAERADRGDDLLVRTFLTPTLVHLGVVFLIAVVALSPEGDDLIVPFGLVGIIGLVYALGIARRAARVGRLLSDALLFHVVLPGICYLGIISAAWLGMTSTRQANLVLRVVSAALLLIAMRNAWAVAIDVARRKPE